MEIKIKGWVAGSHPGKAGEKSARMVDLGQQMELEEESKRRQMDEVSFCSNGAVQVLVLIFYLIFMVTQFYRILVQRMKLRDEEEMNDRIYASQRKSIQKSERARAIQENKLDDLRTDLQARIQERRRRSDRWVPPEYAQVVKDKAQQAVKAMRLRKEKERESRKQREMAAAASFLEGRVRQKVSRFSRVVEDIQSAQQQRAMVDDSGSWGFKEPIRRESTQPKVRNKVEKTQTYSNPETWRRSSPNRIDDKTLNEDW
jgi:hypothetical protein